MKRLGKWAALLLAGVLATSALAADKQLRIGTLATKNSLYHRQLMELGEAWRTAQGGNAKYLVYPDGSQGGETVAPIVVNSSRAILYAASGSDFAAASRKEALRTRDVLASACNTR